MIVISTPLNRRHGLLRPTLLLSFVLGVSRRSQGGTETEQVRALRKVHGWAGPASGADRENDSASDGAKCVLF